jgi:hypothetical protein
MQTQTKMNHMRRNLRDANAPIGDLPVRTNLRAGLAWDDPDDHAIAVWYQVKEAASSAAQAVSNMIQGQG